MTEQERYQSEYVPTTIPQALTQLVQQKMQRAERIAVPEAIQADLLSFPRRNREKGGSAREQEET